MATDTTKKNVGGHGEKRYARDDYYLLNIRFLIHGYARVIEQVIVIAAWRWLNKWKKLKSKFNVRIDFISRLKDSL